MPEAAATEKPQPVTARIERIMGSVPGWTPADQLLALHMLAVTTAALGGDVVEIGSWCGRFSAVLGHAVATTGIGKVWAIDLFPGAATGAPMPTAAIPSPSMSAATRSTHTKTRAWDEPFQRDIATVYARYDGILDLSTPPLRRSGWARS